MAVVTAYDELKTPPIQRILPDGDVVLRADFIERPEDKSIDTPMAFLVTGSTDYGLRVHFHEVDQFQVVHSGSGTLGKHAVSPGAVHFARAFTPYGPISYGDTGLGFITLRAHRDPGAQYFPESRPVMEKVVGRTPWQITAFPDFAIVPGEGGVAMKALDGMHGGGLAGFSVKMNASAKAYAPNPSKTDGQFILVIKGGIVHEGKVKKDLTIIWVANTESMFELVTGPEGMEGIILNFPAPGGGNPDQTQDVAIDAKGSSRLGNAYSAPLCTTRRPACQKKAWRRARGGQMCRRLLLAQIARPGRRILNLSSTNETGC